MADKKYNPIDPRLLNNSCAAETPCPPEGKKQDCGEEDCSGVFEFTTPAILYAGCSCDTDQLLNLYQVITNDDGEETECYIGTVRRSSPFQREFTITGKYRIKWCVDFCSPCYGDDPEFYTSPLPDAAMATVDFEERCDSETDTVWRRTVQFYSPDPTQPEKTIQTVLSDVNTLIPCGDLTNRADIEHQEYCNPDGFLYVRSVYHTFDENGIPSPEVVLKDWTKTDQRCIEECIPYTADAYGEANPTFEPFKQYTVIKPKCCELKVVTTAGTIILRSGETTYTSSYFKCPINLIGLESDTPDCLAKTHIIVESN